MEAIIEVNDLWKSFKTKKQEVEVLKGVGFSVRRGQVFSLLGSNGAGKTTIVRILATLTKPDRCDAKVCGFDLKKEPGKVRECISLTGQFAAVDDMLTGRENMRLIAELRGLKNYNARIDELFEIFELADAAGKRVKTYSGGMKRKIDIAMSLLGEPKIIFLDEPTTGLDPQSRLSLWKMIKELSDSGTTIFLTTQYLEEAENLADYIAVLNEGKIIAGGTLSELKNLMPEWKPVMVETSPSLEDVFLSLIKSEIKENAGGRNGSN